MQDSRGADSAARGKSELAFRGTGGGIETWPGVITESWRDGGSYVIDFTVGQSFDE